jgi:hypothetical protein
MSLAMIGAEADGACAFMGGVLLQAASRVTREAVAMRESRMVFL